MAHEHNLPLDEYHRAGAEIVTGNPEVYQAMYSRGDDVTLANPFGLAVRGWSEVSSRLDRAADNFRSNFQDGEAAGVENIATVVTSDLAYILEIERYQIRARGALGPSPMAIRVTTVFRPEDGEWKVVHRHADPITTERPPQSIVQT
ncbi:MAG TPA: nuclear transport factor 2 family protein [Sporichthya sp.]|nr:nuclear transport factor 2 family protein [Sporichthya sp.]